MNAAALLLIVLFALVFVAAAGYLALRPVTRATRPAPMRTADASAIERQVSSLQQRAAATLCAGR
jgi:hypothetical protein